VDQLPATLLYEFDFPPENDKALMLLDRIGPLFEGAFSKNSSGDMSFSSQYNKLTYKAQIDPLIHDFGSLGIDVFSGFWIFWKNNISEIPVFDDGDGNIIYERNWWPVKKLGFFFTSQKKISRAVANVDRGISPPEFKEDGFLDMIDGRELKITAEQHFREWEQKQMEEQERQWILHEEALVDHAYEYEPTEDNSQDNGLTDDD
jgi:hypothetical protein